MNFDNKIFDLAKKDSSSKDALLALRGRISFPIFQKVNEIFRKNNYQFENEKINLNDMLIIVLDDSGEKYLRIPLKIDAKKINEIVKLLEHKSEEKLKNLDYRGAIKALRRAEKYISN